MHTAWAGRDEYTTKIPVVTTIFFCQHRWGRGSHSSAHYSRREHRRFGCPSPSTKRQLKHGKAVVSVQFTWPVWSVPVPALEVLEPAHPVTECLQPNSDSTVGCNVCQLRRNIAVELPCTIAAE